jgi:hypothetical protein
VRVRRCAPRSRAQPSCWPRSGEVAPERLVGPSQLRFDSLDFRLPPRALGVELGEGFGDRLAHHVLLGETALELAEDRLLELRGRQAIGVAALSPVALPREADVVRVASAVAVGGGADVALAAARALNQPREQVVALVRAPKRRVLAALAKQVSCPLEEAGGNERLVRRRIVAPAEDYERARDVRP